MKYQEYIDAARSFEAAAPPSAVQIPALENYDCLKLTHYALGIATEALELLDAVKRAKPYAEQQLELSDILWFSGLAAAELGVEITDVEIINNRSPKQGVFDLADKCEEFASRIKAALIYGTPVKPRDEHDDSWKQLAKQIFLHACAMGDAGLGAGKLMDLNITKLSARYPKGRFEAAAAVNRVEWKTPAAPSPELIAAVKATASVPTAPAQVVEPPPAKPIGKTPEIMKMINFTKPQE